jgi:uncharacterized membrane protein YoaK (UPF0700 family)
MTAVLTELIMPPVTTTAGATTRKRVKQSMRMTTMTTMMMKTTEIDLELRVREQKQHRSQRWTRDGTSIVSYCWR